MTRNKSYPYVRGDGVPVACPLFQGEGGGSIPTSPLQLHIEPIDARTAMALNAHWHSRLPHTFLGNIVGCKRSVCFAATLDGGYYATAIWTDPIAANRMTRGWYALELRRFAIGPEAPKNTASRMLAIMVRLIKQRWPELERLISYQDTESHLGTIYKASNWHATGTSPWQDWNNPALRDDRTNTAPVQSKSDKVRWELSLTAHRTDRNAPRLTEQESQVVVSPPVLFKQETEAA